MRLPFELVQLFASLERLGNVALHDVEDLVDALLHGLDLGRTGFPRRRRRTAIAAIGTTATTRGRRRGTQRLAVLARDQLLQVAVAVLSEQLRLRIVKRNERKKRNE